MGRGGYAIAASALRTIGLVAALVLPAYVLWDGREQAFGSAEVAAAAPASEDGWATLLLGGPSGAPARPLPAIEPQAPPRAQASAPLDAAPAAPSEGARQQDSRPHAPPRSRTRPAGDAFLPVLVEERRTPLDVTSAPRTDDAASAAPRVPDDFELVIAPNMTLGEIAQIYYDTAHPDVVRALANYNGLSDPDALRVGRTLWVPDRAKLGVDLGR